MSQDQAEYQTDTDETREAMEMLGKGYNTDPIPPNEFVSTISGFTLAPDVLIDQYGYVTALVWGVTWRFCQMSDGVCRAGLEKIAARLGMSERTIIRHLDVLCDGGFLFDTTPNLKNKPHIYADTGKIRVRLNIGATMTESQRAMTESQRQGDRESVEESIKKQSKKKNNSAAKPPKAPTPEEVKLFRSVTERYPQKANFQDVVDSVQRVRDRLGRDVVRDDLLPFFKKWCGLGYKPVNLAWLEWAEAGEIPQNGKWKPKNQEEPRGFEAGRRFLERQGMTDNG